MKIIQILTLYLVMSSGVMLAMFKHCLPEIRLMVVPEPTEQEYLKEYGSEDASFVMQERLEEVVYEYKQQGLILPEKMIIKQMKLSAIEDLAQQGSTLPNVVNNGINTLHTTCNHKELTEQESKQLLAHELAHIALGTYKWLNPHWYMHKCTRTSVFGIISIIGSRLLWHAVKTDSKSAYLAAIMVPIYIFNAVKWRNHSTASLRPLSHEYGKLGKHYHCLGKLEEIECDLIAACVMPDGGKHGAALWQKKLEMYGNRNGINGSHPYYSTRVKYHKAIQWLQEREERS